MPCELWALDPQGGEAVLRQGRERWYLVSMERSWRPLAQEFPSDVLQWAACRCVVPVRRKYRSMDDAVLAARSVCRATWRTGTTSSEEILQILKETAHDRDQLHAADPPGWNERFPEISKAALELDTYFQEQGCSQEESLHRILKILQLLKESGEWRLSGRLLHLALRRLARQAGLAAQRQARDPVPAPQLSEYERRRLKKALERLPYESLATLTYWADPSRSQKEVAILVGAPLKEVRKRLAPAVQALGRPAEQLRGEGVVEICQEILKARF